MAKFSFVVEIVVSQMFHGLRMDVHDVTQCSAEFVSLRDIEVILYRLSLSVILHYCDNIKNII